MKVGSVWRSTEAWLQRQQRAVRRFFGPFESADAPAAPDARKRVPAPFCVSYGRVVFRLYYPEPRPGHRHVKQRLASASTSRDDSAA